ncbi:MAG TPA: protein kinase [Streptosporangiaceae bacterium]|nr:protein kinase [Streptosporangiaceae bacterium]
MATLPMVGDDLAGYRLRGVLGRGGMSVVFEAENPRLGSTVALKVLAPELATDDVFRARFLKESRIAASLNHPNVIPIYDMGTHEDLLFISMRYVAGADLRTVLKSKHVLEPGQVLLLTGQAARALDAAHRHGLVHRDVKPGNILVEHGADEEDPDHVYLTDFGITKHANSRSGLTATGQFMGTIDYIAPEQIQGKPVDGRADIYSLGCVLYECLTGRVPFAKDLDAAVIWAHVEEMPTTPSSVRPTLPRDIDEVIGRALAKDPADRYASCREFITAARAALGATAVPDTGTSHHAATVLAAPGAAAVGAAAASAAAAAAAAASAGAPAAPAAPAGAPAAPAAPPAAPVSAATPATAAPAASAAAPAVGEDTAAPAAPAAAAPAAPASAAPAAGGTAAPAAGHDVTAPAASPAAPAASPAPAAAAAAPAAGADTAAPAAGHDVTAPQPAASSHVPPAPSGPVHEQPPAGPPPGGPPPSGTPKRPTRRQLVAGVSALVLVIAALGGWLIWRSTTSNSPTHTATGGAANHGQHAGGWLLGHSSPFPVQQLHAAVLNGQIWMAGGLTGATEATDKATNKTEYYSLAARTWRAGPPLPFAVHHATIVSFQGKLYVIGGFLPSGNNLEAAASNKVLILDPSTKHWVEGPPLHHARAAGAAVVVGNQIVVVGGRTGGRFPGEVGPTEIFNGKSWHDAANIPVPGDHLAAVTDGKYVYALGGRTLTPSANHNAVQRFDPATNQWTPLTPLPVANSDMGAAYVRGQLITFGGENGLSVFPTVRSYNLAAKTWSTLAPMAKARHGMGVAVVGNTIYAIDGASLPGHNGSTNTVQTFNVPAAVAPTPVLKPSGGWTLGRSSPFPVQQLHAAVLNGSQIWLAGGLTGSTEATDQATNKTEYYDPVVHTWNPGPNLPFPVHHAMLVSFQGKLYLIGGFLPSGNNLEAAASSKVLILDPATGRWVEGPPLHHARAAGAAVVVGNQIVVVGGRTGGRFPAGQADRDLQRQELARRR